MHRIQLGGVLVAAMSFSVSALAVDGAYGSFKAQVDVSAGSDFGTSLLLQADGKLLMAGSCTDSKGGGFCATRLLANGSYDATFGSAGLGYLSFDEFPGFPASNSLTASARPPTAAAFMSDIFFQAPHPRDLS